MNIWRMKLRVGSGGDDMLPECKKREIVSMTHGPIYDLDLTGLKKADVPSGVMGPARSSIWNFAWDIMGGDVILIGDSKTHSIVARGFVRSEPGERAYRFNGTDPLREPSAPDKAWRHEVPVQWDSEFHRTRYKDGAPRYTVKRWQADWAVVSVTDGLVQANPNADLLNDADYHRSTPAFEKNVRRLHASLSNAFKTWLNAQYGLQARQEKDRIDLEFRSEKHTHLVEFKICYGTDTRFAIREALGQILEYNLYPPREAKTSWIIVMDAEPSTTDRTYFAILRKQIQLPVTLMWSAGASFQSDRDFLA